MVPPTDSRRPLLPVQPHSAHSDQHRRLPPIHELFAGVADTSPEYIALQHISDLPSQTTAEEEPSATGDWDPDSSEPSPIFSPWDVSPYLRRLRFRTYKIDNMPYTCPVPENEDVSHVQRRTVDGRLLTYRLTVLQQPERARACGAGARCKSSEMLHPSTFFW